MFFILYCTFMCFFFNATATTEIYTYLHTLSLHDALPISLPRASLGVRAADVQRQPVGPLRAWLSDLIRGSAAPAVEKGQPLEQHDVLLILQKRAVQWRNGLFRVLRLQNLQRHVLVQQQLQPVEQFRRRGLFLEEIG